MSRGYNSDGVGLSTIGLGSDFNINLMRDLALQADGNFYFLEDSGAVREVFDEELDFFVVPVAFDLQLSLTAGAGYDFGRAYGTPLWEDTTRGGELDVPSVFLAHRQSADDVTEDEGRRGGGSQLLVELMANGIEPDGTTEVATIGVQFREPGSNEIVEDRVTVEYPFSPSDVQASGFFEGDNVSVVQKSFVMLNIFVGMERAVTDFAAGNADATTIAELDSLIAAVVDYNEEVQDKDIELDLELLQMLRSNLLAARVPDESVPPPSNPWPAD
jgi:Ca-activated chloride channel family protein